MHEASDVRALASCFWRREHRRDGTSRHPPPMGSLVHTYAPLYASCHHCSKPRRLRCRRVWNGGRYSPSNACGTVRCARCVAPKHEIAVLGRRTNATHLFPWRKITLCTLMVTHTLVTGTLLSAFIDRRRSSFSNASSCNRHSRSCATITSGKYLAHGQRLIS